MAKYPNFHLWKLKEDLKRTRKNWIRHKTCRKVTTARGDSALKVCIQMYFILQSEMQNKKKKYIDIFSYISIGSCRHIYNGIAL